MTRFLNLTLFSFLLALSLTGCTDGPDDRTAYLSSLTLSEISTEIVNDVEVITDMQFDAALEPGFEPRTLFYSAKASCFTSSLDVLPFAAYPGIDISIDHAGGMESPETIITPVNILTPNNSITTFTIELSGDSYITTTYDVSITRGDQNPTPAPPAIKLNGDYVINHTLDTPYTDAKAEACGDDDIDLKDQIITIGNNLVLVDKLGTYFITYNVTDSNDLQATQITRTVNVVTNTAPVITLLGDPTVTVDQRATYEDAGATAFDAQERELDNIRTNIANDNPDTSTPGKYTITYDVTDLEDIPDMDGLDAIQVTRTVEVVAAP